MLDHIGNVCTADARGNLNEVKLAIGVRFQKFRVSHATHESERLNQFFIHRTQRLCILGITFKRSRREHSTGMRNIEWRRAVRMRVREHHFPFAYHAVYMKNAARYELLQ